MSYKELINEYLDQEISTLKKLDLDAIDQMIKLLVDAQEAEKNIFIFGNGGSAATASHFQNDFNKGISEHSPKKFNFICLNDNVPTVMAIANDIGYEEIFRFQLTGKVKPGDLVIGISGSGNSRNVLNAIEYANSQNAVTIGITGYDGGKLKQIVHHSLHVPIHNMQITEDIHMVFDHLMVSVFYNIFYRK